MGTAGHRPTRSKRRLLLQKGRWNGFAMFPHGTEMGQFKRRQDHLTVEVEQRILRLRPMCPEHPTSRGGSLGGNGARSSGLGLPRT